MPCGPWASRPDPLVLLHADKGLNLAITFGSCTRRPFGEELRTELEECIKSILLITNETRLLENDPVVRRAVEARLPFCDTLNIVQGAWPCPSTAPAPPCPSPTPPCPSPILPRPGPTHALFCPSPALASGPNIYALGA